jgi:transcription initiation factor TFIIH subunit 1
MAGVDLRGVAARSAREGATSAAGGDVDDEDARVNGGCDCEMRRLVGFANAHGGDADFARGVGDDDDDDGHMELRLRDVGAYAGKFGPSDGAGGKDGDANLHLQYARILAAKMRAQTEPILREKTSGRARGFCNAPTLTKPLPDPKIGRGLLEALTKKMSADSRTEADVQHLADTLPEEFKTKLAAFFRRASELLRHFFSLRSVFSESGNANGGIGQSESQKNRLASIVKGMEKVGTNLFVCDLSSALKGR